jgi:homocysteine S-methyltransferase
MGVRALREWHRPRLDALAAAGPDVLALETVPSLEEAEALLLEVEAIGLPAWLSLTCAGTATRRGEAAVEAFTMARDVTCVLAVGVNCTDPRDVSELVRLAARASGKPVVAYPNSGETWDPVARSWTGTPDLDLGEVDRWLVSGARVVGGCCRVGPREIATLAEHVRAAAPPAG